MSDKAREDKIVAAIRAGAKTGSLVDFLPKDALPPAEDKNLAAEAEPSFWEDRTLSAERLRAVILECAEDETTHERGLRIRGLRITGKLDLYNTALRFPLRFQFCRLEDTVLIGHAALQTFEISQSWLLALVGRGVRINGNLKMHYSVSQGPVVLEGAAIKGWADFWGMQIMPDGPGVEALPVDANLPKALREHNAEENDHALLLRVAQIGNDLRLTGLKAGGPLHFEELEVDKRLFLDDAHVEGRRRARPGASNGPREVGYAVKAGGLEVMGNALLSGSTFRGEVRLTGTQIQGSLRMVGTKIISSQHRSLMLDRATIWGDLRFGDRKPHEARDADEASDVGEQKDFQGQTQLEGAVRMRKAKICGDLNLSSTRIEARGYPNGFAIRMTGAEVQGELIAVDMEIQGTFDISNSRILRKIRFDDCEFNWAVRSERELNAALEANHAYVASDVVIDRCHFEGPAYLQDADIRGTLYLKECTLRGTDETGERRDQVALAAERITVGANIAILDRDGTGTDAAKGLESRFIGGINLADASVDGGLIIQGGRFEGLGEEAVNQSRYRITLRPHEAIHASGIKLERGVKIGGNAIMVGTVNLEEATIEDEISVDQAIIVDGYRGQGLRLTLAKVRGSIYLGHAARHLGQEFRAAWLKDLDQGLVPKERELSFLCLGQINLSGARIDGFLRLRSLHCRNPLDPDDHYTSFETLSVNAAMAEIGKDVYVHRSDPDETKTGREEQGEASTDVMLVSVIGPVSFEQAEIRGNLSLDRMALRSRRAAMLALETAMMDAPGNNAGGNEAGEAPTGPTGSDEKQPNGPGVAMGATLMASSVKVSRSVYLGQDFETLGEANFARAIIGQSFVSQGRHESPPENIHLVGRNVARALACQGIEVGVTVDLRVPFTATGLTDFTQAVIYSSFRTTQATFIAPEGTALELPGAHIGRKLTIDKETDICGDLDLTGTRVEADLQIWRDSFGREGRRQPDHPPRVIACRLFVKGILFIGVDADRGLARQGTKTWDNAIEPGNNLSSYQLDLTDAQVGVLSDDHRAWPDKGELILNGFTYNRISENAPVEAALRKDWLYRQPAPFLGKDFDPQPFDQIVRVLRQQGQPDVAEDLDVAKRTLRIQTLRNPFYKLFERISRVTMKFGYQPQRAILALAFFTVLGAILFSSAYHTVDPAEAVSAQPMRQTRCIAPADPEFYFGRNGEERSYPPADYPAFHPLHYSFDLIIPIIDLRQAHYWIAASNEHCKGPWIDLRLTWRAVAKIDPSETLWGTIPLGPLRVTMVYAPKGAYWVKLYQSLHIAVGWFCATLFAALISGLVRPRRES